MKIEYDAIRDLLYFWFFAAYCLLTSVALTSDPWFFTANVPHYKIRNHASTESSTYPLNGVRYHFFPVQIVDVCSLDLLNADR